MNLSEIADGLVAYYTTSEEMAHSYAEMYSDLFGEVHKEIITIRNPTSKNIDTQGWYRQR
jgi:hypothetical protein